MKRLASLLWICGLLALVQPALAQPSSRTVGQARIVDGDTIDIGRTRFRLWGIDAPEGKQQCELGGKAYRCGTEATKQLATLISTKDVECEHKTMDRYKRVVAICRVGNLDLSAEMVRVGWALAFVRYSSDYVAQENEARSAKRGLWAGSFQPPWEVR